MLQPNRLKRLVKLVHGLFNSFYLLMISVHCKVFCGNTFAIGKTHGFLRGEMRGFLRFHMWISFLILEVEFQKDECFTGLLTVSV